VKERVHAMGEKESACYGSYNVSRNERERESGRGRGRGRGRMNE